MNVAIVGSSGYIASFLEKRLKNESTINKLLKIDQTQDADMYLDLQHAEKFNFKILNNIDYIIFTAAISGPDQCAADFQFCWSVNVTGTVLFINEAIKRNCRVLFFSSDAVFGDVPGMIYTELSETKATTAYGRMKKAVEDQFKTSPYFKAIRLSYVVSRKDRFVTYCLKCIENNETAEVFHPFYRNCIVVSDVVDVVIWFIFHWDEYTLFSLNVAGRELVSRVRIADELNRILDRKLTYTIIYPDDKFYLNRPKITQMQSLYMQKYHIISDVTFSEKIKKELEDIK